MSIALLLATFAVAPAPALGPTDTEDVGVVDQTETDPTVFPDPRKFSRGFFVEAGLGPTIPVGPPSAVLGLGMSVAGRVGYEIRRWIALQLHATGSISRYDDGVLTQELLQQYAYTGEVRFGIPIRRFVILLYGGGGLYQVNSNLLQVAGIAPDNGRFGFAYDGGLGLDVHTLAKHFSGGVLAGYIGTPRLGNGGNVGLHLYFRYTL